MCLGNSRVEVQSPIFRDRKWLGDTSERPCVQVSEGLWDFAREVQRGRFGFKSLNYSFGHEPLYSSAINKCSDGIRLRSVEEYDRRCVQFREIIATVKEQVKQPLSGCYGLLRFLMHAHAWVGEYEEAVSYRELLGCKRQFGLSVSNSALGYQFEIEYYSALAKPVKYPLEEKEVKYTLGEVLLSRMRCQHDSVTETFDLELSKVILNCAGSPILETLVRAFALSCLDNLSRQVVFLGNSIKSTSFGLYYRGTELLVRIEKGRPFPAQAMIYIMAYSVFEDGFRATGESIQLRPEAFPSEQLKILEETMDGYLAILESSGYEFFSDVILGTSFSAEVCAFLYKYPGFREGSKYQPLIDLYLKVVQSWVEDYIENHPQRERVVL